jgi:hypothetical protein
VTTTSVCDEHMPRLTLPSPPHPIIPRLILSLADTPLALAREDFIMTGAAMAAAPAVLINRRLEGECFEFMALEYFYMNNFQINLYSGE